MSDWKRNLNIYNRFIFVMNDTQYIKFGTKELKYKAFCSLLDCEDEFELGEVLVKQRGNLFHIKCFHDFEDSDDEFPPTKIDVDKTFDNSEYLK